MATHVELSRRFNLLIMLGITVFGGMVLINTTPEMALSDALETVKHLDIEHLSVVKAGDVAKHVGISSRGPIRRRLGVEILARQEESRQ